MDKATSSMRSTSLLQQGDGLITETDPRVPVEILPAHPTSLEVHAQELERIDEEISAQKAARSHDDPYRRPLGLNCEDIVDRSEKWHQDVIHRFNGLESFLSDNEAKKKMIEDLQAKNALLPTELADEKAAHKQVNQSYTMNIKQI